ncbi:MAG TPA: efflux RND transporter periplasmic adaptor subunit [Myxococcota bacterium]|nr:efflux RND transporter periplasmic adaptor subunit [Myxococcota bacterium]HPB51133.1 efflux RND transporter periplasmic adaptor subunit [Myxococcota bacterium]
MTLRTPARPVRPCPHPLAISVFVALLMTSCGAEPPRQIRTTLVDAVAARTATVPLTVRSIGTVEPVQKVFIRPQISGVVQQVLFTEGDSVQAGQVLFKLDRRPFEAARLQASAQHRNALIQADVAKRNLDRGRPLFEKRIISEGEFDGLVAAVDSATAAVELYAAALRSASLNLEYATISAPIPGRAGRMLVFPGDVVTANVTQMVQLNQTAPINVRFTVPEKEIDAIRTAAAGGISVSVSPAVDPSRKTSGTLVFIDNEVDAGTGSLTLKAKFENTDEALWPGQFVQVVAEVGQLTDAVVVPFHAVQNGQTGPYVFVIEDGVAKFRKVVPGRTEDASIVIEQGIAAGEIVVTDGQLKLADGSRVEVRGAAVPATSGGEIQ